MAARLLLDTCAAIWITEDAPMGEEAVAAIDSAFADQAPVLVSPITAWEHGLLVARGRITSPISPHLWFQRLIGDAGLFVSDLTSDILIDSSFLPGQPPNDQADRIIIATARTNDYCIVTRDKKILDYGEMGHVRILPC